MRPMVGANWAAWGTVQKVSNLILTSMSIWRMPNPVR
jgi:hypothetical protein